MHEDKLQETIELLQAVQDSTSVANLVTDANFRIISYNRILKEFLAKNWLHEVKYGDLATDFIHADNLQEFKIEFNQALNGKHVKAEHTYLVDNSRRIWFELEYFPVIIGKNREKHVAFSFKNITRRKTNEERIKRQYERLKEIAFYEAHQLRGPVSSLLGLINLIKNDQSKKEDQDLYLNQMDTVSVKIDIAIKEIIKKSDEITQSSL